MVSHTLPASSLTPEILAIFSLPLMHPYMVLELHDRCLSFLITLCVLLSVEEEALLREHRHVFVFCYDCLFISST